MNQFLYKVKKFLMDKDILTVLIIIFVGTASFGLGRLSVAPKKTPVKIEHASTTAAVASTIAGSQNNSEEMILTEGGKVVASKNGSKYHYPWCSGGKTISEANKIWFDSIEVARAAC